MQGDGVVGPNRLIQRLRQHHALRLREVFTLWAEGMFHSLFCSNSC